MSSPLCNTHEASLTPFLLSCLTNTMFRCQNRLKADARWECQGCTMGSGVQVNRTQFLSFGLWPSVTHNTLPCVWHYSLWLSKKWGLTLRSPFSFRQPNWCSLLVFIITYVPLLQKENITCSFAVAVVVAFLKNNQSEIPFWVASWPPLPTATPVVGGLQRKFGQPPVFIPTIHLPLLSPRVLLDLAVVNTMAVDLDV